MRLSAGLRSGRRCGLALVLMQGLAVCVLAGSSTLPAAETKAPSSSGTNTDRRIGVSDLPTWAISNAVAGVSATLVTPGFEARVVEGGYVLQIPGAAARQRNGAPDLPTIATVLPGRPGYRAVLVDTRAVSESVPLIVVPSFVLIPPGPEQARPSVRVSATRKGDPQIYSRNDFWPAQRARVEEAWIGTQKYVRVECAPLRYNPSQKTVEWSRVIEARLRFDPEAR